MGLLYRIALINALVFIIITGISVIVGATGDGIVDMQVFRALATSACWSLLAIAAKPGRDEQ
jgi:hypothetical protein